MAFIDVLPLEKPEMEPGVSQVIQLDFLEPVKGFAALYLPTSCKKLVVENIYGAEWESLKADQIDDCLLELLNVLVGNYLSDLFGEEVKRDMALPRLLFDDSEIKKTDDQLALYFDAEGSSFKALLDHRDS